MGTWNSRGLRGSFLEEMINLTNEKYRDQKLALIQKVPTPIKPIRIDQATRHITLAYFDQKSTVDYIGVVQGIPVCFDAKECASERFPLANVHPHQIRFMQEFEEQDILKAEISICIFPAGLLRSSGSGWNRADLKVFIWMNWILLMKFRLIPVLFCTIWSR